MPEGDEPENNPLLGKIRIINLLLLENPRQKRFLEKIWYP